MVRQASGSIRAFDNTCPHRGNRLVLSDLTSSPRITCSDHGWQLDPLGTLLYVQDADDFRGGSPCVKEHLTELRCET
ncbi:MAG: Rieske 2Fe-2S domain-containing protein [Porphyrobacter sp.]|jgi:phenylpropionate dioxygenase-like ring-hydroxylating dioxygenase large terminal subunit|nr:Rieske 2Fe-2S domain-containing protein [Porphyrobacter sp.]